ncbi:hypothetical protein Sros01_72770 [Streptomyces roseochromogenus]|nr:hypothetical protein Sros01_72770 [Streptomyces roseochromogenus]
MTVASEISACPTCREISDTWWAHGLADDRSSLWSAELALYGHFETRHPTVGLARQEGCRGCHEVVAMAQFAMTGTAMYLKDGT